jgi:hypothetical protein
MGNNHNHVEPTPQLKKALDTIQSIIRNALHMFEIMTGHPVTRSQMWRLPEGGYSVELEWSSEAPAEDSPSRAPWADLGRWDSWGPSTLTRRAL